MWNRKGEKKKEGLGRKEGEKCQHDNRGVGSYWAHLCDCSGDRDRLREIELVTAVRRPTVANDNVAGSMPESN